MKRRRHMKRIRILPAVLCACGFLAGCATGPSPSPQTSVSIKYAVKVHEFEGCECNPVCPCVFSSDTTFGDCRGITVFTFAGTYGTTRLKELSCVLVFTWAGKHMEGNLGKWKGVLYTSDQGTPGEREAIAGLLHVMMGDAFATLEQRTAPIQISRRGDIHDLTVGTRGASPDSWRQRTKRANSKDPERAFATGISRYVLCSGRLAHL